MSLRCLAELAFSTKSSMESDVYSYGVVLLELLTRRTAVDPSFPDSTDIVGWVSSALNGTDKIEAVCDPALMEEVFGTVEMEEVRKVLSVALRCAAREASQRPSMAAVVKELTGVRPATGCQRRRPVVVRVEAGETGIAIPQQRLLAVGFLIVPSCSGTPPS